MPSIIQPPRSMRSLRELNGLSVCCDERCDVGDPLDGVRTRYRRGMTYLENREEVMESSVDGCNGTGMSESGSGGVVTDGIDVVV